MIQCFVDHRREVIRRRTEHLLREAKKQAHRLEGLIFAVCDIDEVIALIRGSKTREEAIEKLMDRAFRIAPDHRYAAQIPASLLEMAGQEGGVRLTQVQAEAIGGLRLIQLVGLEVEKLVGEYELAGQVGTVELSAADRLTLTVTGQPTYTLEPQQGTTFGLQGMDGFSVEFELADGQDRASAVTFRQPNGTFKANRKE